MYEHEANAQWYELFIFFDLTSSFRQELQTNQLSRPVGPRLALLVVGSWSLHASKVKQTHPHLYINTTKTRESTLRVSLRFAGRWWEDRRAPVWSYFTFRDKVASRQQHPWRQLKYCLPLSKTHTHTNRHTHPQTGTHTKITQFAGLQLWGFAETKEMHLIL